MSKPGEDIQHAVAADHPLIYLYTEEETRAAAAIESLLPDGCRLMNWTCTRGLETAAGKQVANTTDPLSALTYLQAHPRDTWFVLRDLPDFFQDPRVVRTLKDCYRQFRGEPGTRLFITCAELTLPESLRQSLHVIDLALPDSEEQKELARQVLAQYGHAKVPAETLNSIALSLGGLTLDESYHVLAELGSRGTLSRQGLLEEIRLAKKASVTGADYLAYVPLKQGIEQIAGLGQFKSWMLDRAQLFTRNALDQDLPIPRGILIMGISGCGKSLCAKVLASTWKVPLFRLDMNLVFSGVHGNPQATFHKALKTMEAVAPAVLWIDEIENALGTQDLQNSVQAHIFSAFLTWMQEKPPLVFVAATANRIEYLPAEFIRKGRFDQVFFVDLPDDKDRREMIELYLRRHGADPAQFDLRRIVSQTLDWNGAEIEQLIESARIHALSEKRPFTTQDVLDLAQNTVPLSQTMSEQIKALRDWAWDRATPASSENAMVLHIDEH